MDRINYTNLMAVIGIVLWDLVAMAYPAPVGFDGKVVRWPIGLDEPQVHYEIVDVDNMGTYFYEVIVDEAASQWNSVLGSYIELLNSADTGAVADITINLQSSIASGEFASAYTVYDEMDDTGLLKCSIYAGTAGSYTTFAKTILHELGHCLGLGHSLIPEAIMSYYLDKNTFALDIDDEAALSRLYPADGSIPKLPPGCSIVPEIEKSTENLILLFLFFPVFFSLKKSHPDFDRGSFAPFPGPDSANPETGSKTEDSGC